MRIPPFECAGEEHPAATVRRVHGEVDLWTADALRAHLLEAASRGRPLILDLGGVTCLPSMTVRRLVTLLQLEDALPLRSTVADALVGTDPRHAE